MENTEEHQGKTEKLVPINVRTTTDDTSRSSSPNVATIPFSMRQQQILLKQMEQPSPGGSTDSERPTTPSRKGKVSKIHRKNNHGETPLHVAARRNQVDKCAAIIKDGADVNCPDYAGWTPLHEACSHQAFDIAKLLIESGADVNKASADGITPLHDAAAHSDIQICWLLLLNKADRSLKTKNNQRPIDLTKSKSVEDLLSRDDVPLTCPSPPRELLEKTPRTPSPSDNFKPTTSSMDQGTDEIAESDQKIDEQAESITSEASSPGIEIIGEVQAPQPALSPIPQIIQIDQLNLSEASTPISSRQPSPAPVQESSASVSPDRTIQEEPPQTSVYDYQEEEEVKEEEVKKKAPRTPKGKAGRATNSGSATPVRRGFKGGRGGKRGGRGGPRVAELAAEQLESMAEDPYAFRATPDSEMDANEEREASVGPSTKKARMEEESMGLEEEPEEEEEHHVKTNIQKKVPILRISLAKAPSEEEDHTVTYGKTKSIGVRGKNSGKRGNDAEEQRVTRSKVRQAGRGLDDDTTWANKKKRNRQAPEPIVEEAIEDFPMARLVERQATPNPEFLSEGEKLTYMPPHTGRQVMKKVLAERWFEGLKEDKRKAGDTNARFEGLLLCAESRTLELHKASALQYDTKLPRLPPEMNEDSALFSLLTKQLQDRQATLLKMKADRMRKQFCYEEEYIRMIRREDGTAPQMSAVRIFRETEICNPLMLDVPVHTPPLIDRTAFKKKIEEGIYKLYRDHSMDANALYSIQRDDLRQHLKKKQIGNQDALIDDLVPLIHPERLTLKFNNL